MGLDAVQVGGSGKRRCWGRLDVSADPLAGCAMARRGEESVPLPQSWPTELLQSGRRLDGRGAEEFRTVCESLSQQSSFRSLSQSSYASSPKRAVMQTNVISQASGSAYVELGCTKVKSFEGA